MNFSERLDEAVNCFELTRYGQAEQLLDELLVADPGNSDAWHLRSLLARKSGNVFDAIEYIEHAIAIDDEVADYYFSCGEAYRQLDNLGRAAECYQKAIALDPEHHFSQNNLGMVLHRKGDNMAAKRHYLKAVRLCPYYCDAHFGLAVLLYEEGHYDEALAALEKSLRINPKFIPALMLKGDILLRDHCHDEAVKNYQLVMQITPDDVSVLSQLGQVQLQLGLYDEAISSFHQILCHDRHLPHLSRNLALAYYRSGLFQQAKRSYLNALALDPRDMVAHRELASLLLDEGELSSAVTLYQQITHTHPHDVQSHHGLGIGLLLQGGYRKGWLEYGWSPQKYFQLNDDAYDLRAPYWQGEPLTGKRVLLLLDERTSDLLQFIRVVPLLAEDGAEVVVQCSASLSRLIATVPGVAQVVHVEQELSSYDYRTTLYDVLSQFEISASRCRKLCPWPYLHATESFSSIDNNVSGYSSKLKVGIRWQCNSADSFYHQNSCPLPLFEELAQLSWVELYSLKLNHDDDQHVLYERLHLIDLTDQVEDYADMAALISGLDLVVTVDGAGAHLAAAMGKEVWLLLPYTAEWRWTDDDDVASWYPSMRLFRQTTPGDWADVIHRVKQALMGHDEGDVMAAG